VQGRGGSEFYSNKLLTKYKGKDEQQVAWVNAFNGYLKGMETYIKDFHRTGLTWSGQADAKSFAGGAGPAAAAKPAAASAAAAKPAASAAAAAPAGGNLFS